jgi:hypothetical protein
VVLPVREVAQAGTVGVVDLGAQGLAALAVVCTVSWTLRSSIEQDCLVATFGRWLHSLSAPAHVLIRAMPLDLSGHITRLDQTAGQLGDSALAEAAADHAGFLAQLADEHDLLRHQVILVFREPSPPTPAASPAAQARRDRAALTRLSRRLTDAATLLAPAGLTVTALDAEQAATVLTAACRPQLTGLPQLTGHPEHNPTHFGAAGAPTAGDERESEDEGWYPLLPGGWPR